MQLDTSKRFEKSIIWGTVFVDLLILVSALFFLYHSRTHFLESLDVSGHNLVQLLEQRIADKARLVDGAVLRVERELELQLQSGQLDAPRLLRQLHLEAETLPEVESIRVSDSQGDLLWGAGLDTRKKISVADRSFFQDHKGQCGEISIVSSPAPDPVSGRWMIAFTRCYQLPDGHFGGVITAAVPLDVFTRIVGNLNFGPNGTAVMRYQDGGLIARVPSLEGSAGQPGEKHVCPAYLQLLESNIPVGSFQTKAAPDAIERACSYRRVMGWPFTISVGLVEHEYLAPWRIQAALGALLLGVLLFTITTIAWITLRRLREQAERAKEREEDLIRRRILIDQSRDAIVILDKEGKVYEANRSFADMLGYTAEEIKNLHVWDWDAHWSEDELRGMVNQVNLQGEELNTRHRRKDGQLIDVEISTNAAEFEGNKLVLCVCRDVSERNQARDALKTSEEKYRVIFENQLYSVAIFDVITLRFLDVNATCERMYGYSRDELLGGMTILDLSAEQEKTRQAVVESNEQGAVFIPLRHHRKKDGTNFPVEIVGGPFAWNGRNVMFCMTHDISARSLAAENLREREELYRILITSLRDGFFACDAQGIVTYVNEPLAKMLNAPTVDQLIGRSIFEFVAPVDLERVQTHFEQATEQREVPLTLEVTLLREGGGILCVEAKPTMISRAQGGASIQGLIIDITKRKQAAEDLKKSEERLTLALQASNDALWDWNLETAFLYTSPRWFEMCGYMPEELPSTDDLWRGLVHPDDKERAERELYEAIDKQAAFAIHVRLRHKDGTYLPVLTRGAVQRDGNGKALRLAGTNTNLSDQRRMEEERRQWERQAQQLQKAESLSRMAGAIAHHFNNLLSVVIGNIEMSLEDLPANAPAAPSLRAATRAGERAVEVSGLLLTYLGQTEGRHQLLDLSALYRKYLPQLQPLLFEGIEIAIAFPQIGPQIVGNAGHLQRMFKNLLVNAAEAIGERQGRIGLSIFLVDPREIADQHRFPVDWDPAAQEYVCLQIEDSGDGIDLFDIEQLFDPFFSSKFTGRGLGLPVVMGIVRSHAGGITVESTLHQGSVFRVYLPLAQEKLAEVKTDFGALGVPREKRVLLVEDEEQVRLMTQTMLNRLGYECLTANDGVEALELFRERAAEIFLVICDLTMPAMDGWEIMATMKELSPGIPFILTSGYDETQVMREGRHQYPQVFLQKPYKKQELGTAVEAALQGADTNR